jgi:hypothetical protein
MASRDYYFYAYADDKNGLGSGVEAKAYLIKIQFNSSFTSFTYQSDHYSNNTGDTTSNEIIQAELQIYINDFSVVYSNAYDLGSSKTWSGSAACSLPNKVRVRAVTWAGADSRYWQATAVLDETYYLHSASSALTVTSTDTHKNIILPLSTSNSGAIRFIKNIRTNNDYYVFLTTFSEDSMEVSGANRLIFIWKYECVTFMPTTNVWYLAGYYTNNLESRSSITTNTNKIGYAVAGQVNTFSVNTNSDREVGDNNVVLPLEVSGKLCIVAYMGDRSAKNINENNVLTFSTASGNGIDNKYNNTNSFPFILSNDSNPAEARERSAGIVFISDGTRWYIVGWYSTYCRTWLRSATPAVINLATTTKINFNYELTSPLTTNANYLLPQYNSSGGNNYLFILKNRQVDSGNGITVYANPQGTATTNPDTVNNVINESINFTGGGCDTKSYGCMWIVSEVRTGENRIHWYPVLNIN